MVLDEAARSLDGAPAGGDPAVLAALTLGWEMADLYATPDTTASPDGPAPEHLPAVSELSFAERIGVAAAKLTALLDRALGLSPSDSRHGARALRDLADGDVAALRPAAYALHVELITQLEARDGTLSRAYDVGRSLAETSRDPHDLGVLIHRLDPARLLPIEAGLADLSSKLAPHSAAAVGATLAQWRDWTSDARAREDLDGVRGALARQRALWHALLCGEKEARQMLDPDTVVAASVRHASRLGTLIRGLTGAYLPALAALVLSVVLLLWTIVDQTGIATVIAALGALAATMIGIRKSLDLTAQDTIDELRGGLWHAELDAAVAQSILRLPPLPAAERRLKLPLGKAPTPTMPPGERMGLSQRLEQALHGPRSAREQGLHVPASGPATAAPQDAEAATTEHPSANGAVPPNEA